MNNLLRLVDLIEWNGTPEHKSGFGNSTEIYLYALIHPFIRTIRYIGITQTPLHRFEIHIYLSLQGKHRNKDLQAWICELVDAGYYPKMTILGMLHPGNCLASEQACIREHQDTIFNKAIWKQSRRLTY